MKAAVIERPGPSDQIRYTDIAPPQMGPGQVLVRTACVTVNGVDTYIRSGSYPIDLPSPYIIGRDVVGTVVEVGSEVRSFRAGDRVWANNQGYAGRQGTFAELLAVDQELLYPLPEGVEETTAVALLHALLTASVGLLGRARIQPGETLFVRAGSGSVGSAALQLAQKLGCRVAVTAGSPSSAAWCQELGADRIIRYKEEALEDALGAFAPDGVDVYWDLTTSADLRLAATHTARRGRILLSSGLTRLAELSVGDFYTRNLSLFGFTVTDQSPEELAHWARVINTHLLGMKARIDDVLPLSQAADAHDRFERGGLEGKIVLRP
jgi:NADPH2:quinone reductase